MELKFSASGIPFIDFDENTRMIFTTTGSSKRFKYVSVRGIRSTRSARRNIEIIERENFIADIYLNGIPKGWSDDVCHSFTKHKATFLRKVFKKYVIEDADGDYIPADKRIMKRIGKDLLKYKEPRKRLKKKKRVRRKVVEIDVEKIKAKREADAKKAEEKDKKEKDKKDKKRKKEIEKLEKEFNGNGKKKRKKRKAKPKKLNNPKPTKRVEMGKTCRACKKELFDSPSCNSDMIVGHNKRWMPVVHKGNEPCKACGVIPGGRHHLYCPHEICPRCKGKFYECGCFV